MNGALAAIVVILAAVSFVYGDQLERRGNLRLARWYWTLSIVSAATAFLVLARMP